MPIYEYQCESCGARREIIVRSGANPRPTCAPCRKRMKRMISPTAFILKGSGWYVTDYPSADRKKGLDAEKAPAAKKESAGDKKESAGEKKDAPAEKKPAAPTGGGSGKKSRAAKGDKS